MYASAFGPPAKNPFTRVVPLHVARRLERERNKYKAWNEESKANAHRALSHADRELVEARAEAALQAAVMRDQANELSEARELLREIRDGEVNGVDEADKFLRCHKASKLSEARAEAARLRALLERADIELLRESQDYVRDGLAADIEEALAAVKEGV
jgi:hypothetical protein